MIRMSIKLGKSALLLLIVLVAAEVPVWAALVSLSASGTITLNNSLDTTIPVGTPWTFELIYDTAAPDRDFELTTTPDPTFGRFTNDGAIPALTSFHYRAGTYEVMLDDPNDFGPFSHIHITFRNGAHAIDINLNAAGLFPPLAGGPVSFHADFNDFTPATPTLTSDALPTDTTIDAGDFQDSSVTLLPASGGAILGTQSDMTSLTIAIVPEPSACALATIGVAVLLLYGRPRSGRRPNAMGVAGFGF